MLGLLGIGGAESGVDVGDIGHSLRFRGAQYLSKTLSAGDQKTLTFSAWVKKAGRGVYQDLLTSGTSASDFFYFGFGTDDTLAIQCYTGSSEKIRGITTAVFRDPTAPFHVQIAIDTNQASGSNGVRLWINGVLQTLTITTYVQNSTLYVNNSGVTHYIGRASISASEYLDGYLSRVCFVDGSALTPSSFGETNTSINEWVSKSQSAVKSVVDAGGTNSFMLDFDNGSSLTTLGYDKSAKGNNWTLNNFSLTAGSTYDWMLDVPGNSFATLNPVAPSAASITNGSLTSGASAVQATMDSLLFASKWEVTAGGSAVTAGVISASGTTNTTTVTANKTFAFRMTAAGALDYRNVTDSGSWTSITTGLTGKQYPYSTGAAANWSFGQAPLHTSATWDAAACGYFFDTTSGYKALCQANMPAPAILNPERHFDVVTRVGYATGAWFGTGAQFDTELLWTKCRNGAYNNVIVDNVRGDNKGLYSNSTSAENTAVGVLLGTGANSKQIYYNGATNEISNAGLTYVDWLWKAGGAPVTNNAGSISSQVSANVEAGFSIVTYTGTGANATVGHGLGVAPKMVIVKSRTQGTTGYTAQWAVFHGANTASPATQVLYLNLTDATITASAYWNNTAPTSSVFSLSTSLVVNKSGDNFVAYCFAEIPGFSKIGSYTGNGSADGPYVECGFKPKWILTKESSAAGNYWVIHDTARDTYNVASNRLYPNVADAEASLADFDICSNGFKLRTTATPNLNGSTYIYIAFADVSAKFSLGR